MATQQHISDPLQDPYALFPDVENRPLSSLEERCLLARIAGCHEMLRVTLSAILWAQDQHHVGWLSSIRSALEAAEEKVAQAENQVKQGVDENPSREIYW
jgi:hypothetical protein